MRQVQLLTWNKDLPLEIVWEFCTSAKTSTINLYTRITILHYPSIFMIYIKRYFDAKHFCPPVKNKETCWFPWFLIQKESLRLKWTDTYLYDIKVIN